MLITITHARQLGYCSSGIRLFCAKNNLDFIQFIKVGFEVEILEQFDDSMIIDLINLAKKELKNGR